MGNYAKPGGALKGSVIRIGTRASRLALWQAEYVAGLLKESGYKTELVGIETRGDVIVDVSIAKIGSKGVFTGEIENRLLDGSIDIAVHSAKDLLSELPDGLELVALTRREPANDVVVSSNENLHLSMDRIRIGTSSTRRQAFVRHYYPLAEIVSVRGNLHTRIRKMEAGECDALILAFAGISRLGFESLIRQRLPTDQFVPSVGQGSIAVECHRDMDAGKRQALRDLVNELDTETCITAERSFLKQLQGGCSIPAFGFAQPVADDLAMEAGIISPDGQRMVKRTGTAPAGEGARLGRDLALMILAAGGDVILEELRKIQP